MIEFVVNPAGASGRTGKEWKKIEELFKDRCEYRVHFSSPAHGIEAICRELTSGDGPVDLVIVGGDGSMNEAVNGIVNFDTVRVGIIPCGSGNDLGKDMGLPADRKKLCDRILEGKVRRVSDIGEVIYYCRDMRLDTDTKKTVPVTETGEIRRRFNISCGIGFDAAICADAEVSPAKEILNRLRIGKLIYIREALHTIFRTEPVRIRVCFDGTREMPVPGCLFIAGMNHRYEGGGFKFCPNADDTDGLLDFCIGDNLTRFDFFRIFPYAYSGAHVRFNGVYQERAKEAEIRADRPLWVHTDGEIVYMSSHIAMRIAEEKLRLLV